MRSLSNFIIYYGKPKKKIQDFLSHLGVNKNIIMDESKK